MKATNIITQQKQQLNQLNRLLCQAEACNTFAGIDTAWCHHQQQAYLQQYARLLQAMAAAIPGNTHTPLGKPLLPLLRKAA